jgi:hypothetical protein
MKKIWPKNEEESSILTNSFLNRDYLTLSGSEIHPVCHIFSVKVIHHTKMLKNQRMSYG